MKCFSFIIAMFLLNGCGVPDGKYNDLKEENLTLKTKIDSLINELDDLKFGSTKNFQAAKEKIENQDFISAKKILSSLIIKYPASPEHTPAQSLLKSINPKAEQQLFTNSVKSNGIEELNGYLAQYPKGRYVARARKLIQQFQSSEKQNADYYVVKPRNLKKSNTAKSKVKRNITTGARVGAICCDGTRSYATGRGACSHHGGVCEWLYQ